MKQFFIVNLKMEKVNNCFHEKSFKKLENTFIDFIFKMYSIRVILLIAIILRSNMRI